MATKIKDKAHNKITSKTKGKAPQHLAQAVPTATYTARELMTMSRAECDAILEAQARQAAIDYAQHPELMEFTTALAGDDCVEY
ncbi:MAG: hypothetical protein JO316_02855 [Abitibacteriaceae bacterium]|nr:hypothetical protein [Abditibacteriaceae bacterium]